MRIVNETGVAHDTRVLDDEGRDITGDLRLKRVVIEAGELNRVTLYCEGVELDVVGDRVDKQRYKRFPDGRLKPFLTPEQYDALRNDDRFLYNRGPRPPGLE